MSPEPRFPHPELATATAAELSARIASGELTAVRLTGMYLERIAAIDQSGPTLRAVIEVNADALEIADAMDTERREGRSRGPLHGLPVLIKDNIDSGDRMMTTAGSLALAGTPAPRDAPLVANLRAAGLVLLGKTNLSEWANFRSTRSSSGWSGRGRQTRNPHVLDRTPSGSSSGSGAATAAGLAAFSVGTETDGSIVSPSNANGVVGVKPGVGVISQSGIVPVAASQDSAGPHARTVHDAALLLEVLAGRPNAFTPGLDSGALRGRRLGVLRALYTGYSEHTDKVYDEALAALRDAGAELVDPADLTTAAELRSSGAELKILLHEFKAGLNSYLALRLGLEVRTLADVIAFNSLNADVEMPYFRQELLEQAQATTGLEAPEYTEARRLALDLAREKGIDALLAEHNLDALVAPSGAPAHVVDRINGDRHLGGSSQPSAVAGYPIVTVPAGVVLGALPVNISFFSRPGSEASLLAIAFAFEQATSALRSPAFLPTLDLP